MKRLLLLLPLLFIAGCGGYGSMAEAESACSRWRWKGGYIKKASSPGEKAYQRFIRACENEAATRQVLGYERPGTQEDTTYIGDGRYQFGTYTNENGDVLGRRRITKRFKY